MAFVVGEHWDTQKKSQDENKEFGYPGRPFGQERGLLISSKTIFLIWYRHRFTDGEVFIKLILKESFLDI